MGDIRFLADYQRVREAKDRALALRGMDDESLIAALAGTTMARDEYLANVLATEAQNRMRALARAMQAVPQPVLVLSYPMRRVVASNVAARRALPLGPSALGGAPFESLVADDAEAPALEAFLESPGAPREMRLRGADGARFRAEVTASPIEDATGLRAATTLVVVDLREAPETRAWNRARRLAPDAFRAPAPWGVEARAGPRA